MTGSSESRGRRLRILYYVEALDIGGAYQTTVTTAVALSRRGHRVYLASLDGPLRDQLLEAGVTHVPVETRVRHPSVRASRRLAEVLDREKIDVLCPNGEDCVLDALLAAIPRGVPVVPTFGGMQNPEYAHPRVPKALVFSGEYREVLIQRFGWRPESLELLIHRIDTQRFRPDLDAGSLRLRWGLPENAPVVLMACRLDPLKIAGVHFLLDAVPELAERIPSVRVVIAGDGRHLEEIKNRVEKINREAGLERVLLPGKVMEMERAFSAASVVVGNGARSGLEGLACGRPVVSVGDSGLAGVFSQENIEHFAHYNFDKGRVFDGSTRRDPRGLATTLAELLEDPGRRTRLGEFGRTYAVKEVGIESGISRLEAILVAARPRKPLQRLVDACELGRAVCSFGWYAVRRRLRKGLLGKGPDPEPVAGAPAPRGFFRDSAMTFGTRILTLAVGVVQSVVIARALHPEGKGALASALLLPQLLATLAPLGITWASTYHLGKKTFDREVLVRAALTALAVLAGVAMILCLGIGLLLRGALLQGVPMAAFVCALLTIPTQVFLVCLDSLFLGEMRVSDANRMSVSRVTLMFLCVLFVLFALHLGVVGVVLAQLATDVLVISTALRRLGPLRLRPLFRWDVVRGLLTYGVQIYSFAILLYLNYRFDVFLVRSFLDLEKTGLYATAVGVGEMLWMVPNSLGRVLFPSIIRAEGRDRDRLTLAVCRNAFWLMFFLCGALALGRNLLVEVFFGREFLPAAPALLALLPGILAMSLQEILGTDLQGRGHPLPVTLAAAVGLALNVVLNLIWIPRFGIVGAALASTVSYGAVALFVIAAFLRISGSRLRDAFLLRREDWGRLTGLLLRAREAVV